MQKIRIENGVNMGSLLDIFVDDEFLAVYSIRTKNFSFASESKLIELGALKEIIEQIEKRG